MSKPRDLEESVAVSDRTGDYCCVCGAYLAASWTQHEYDCPFYIPTSLPTDVRKRLRELKKKP
jgi:hypothetical protein